MPRKIIELPDKVLFKQPYSIASSDVNLVDHLAADKIPSIATQVQINFINYIRELSTETIEESGLIMTYAEVAYLSEGFLDEELEVSVGVANIEGKSFDFIYRIYNLNQEKETARVKNTFLFYDYAAKQVLPIPKWFLALA
jgi:acyl-CoA thioesterase FadM